jgi:hypothetical protein
MNPEFESGQARRNRAAICDSAETDSRRTRLILDGDRQVRGLYFDRSRGRHQDGCRECPEIRQAERESSIGKISVIDDRMTDGRRNSDRSAQ